MRELAAAFLVVVAAAACSEIRPMGVAGFCFAAENDDDAAADALQRNEERAGLEVVAGADEREPPVAFDDCAAGMAARAELVDESGEHVWLALVGRYGARELIGSEVFELVDGAVLRFRQTRGFVPASSLLLANGAQPIVALQSGGDPGGEDFGLLVVEPARATTARCGQFLGHNIHTVERGATSCDDTPAQGVSATWVVADASL